MKNGFIIRNADWVFFFFLELSGETVVGVHHIFVM